MKNVSDALVYKALVDATFALAAHPVYGKETVREAADEEGCTPIFTSLLLSADLL